ncbi:hypothetical protein [Adhaeribacter terreus]|uniref:Uncharacterized protein n=1 Tax=Adhaeribacter terreus TaxID=529703 RepID=A0ABW0E9S6_9BACT
MNNSKPTKPAAIQWLIFSLVFIGIVGTSWKMLSAPKPKVETTKLFPQKPKVDKQDDKILKQMSDF